MSTQNETNYEPLLKELYPTNVVKEMVYKDRPLHALLRKNTGFGGEHLKVPLIYGNPQGRSATFATAQSNKTASKSKAFLITRVSDYAVASLSNQVIKASEKDPYAFAKALQVEMDGAINSLSNSIAIAEYRNGSGSIGQVSASQTLASTTLTLENANSVTSIEVGQKLVFSSTDGGGTVKSGSGFVVAVDRDAGTCQLSATESGSATALNTLVATIAASDYIFIEGDYDAKLKGLSAWIPETLDSGDSFFGVNRNADRTRLAGIYLDKSGLPIEEALIDVVTRVAREGGKPDTIFMDYEQYANLEKALGTKVQYIDVKPYADATFAFRGIAMNSPKGVLKVIPDQNCIPNEAFILTLDTWELASLGEAPSIFETDGVKILRESNADAVEFRLYAYLQMSCNAPGYNARVKLAA